LAQNGPHHVCLADLVAGLVAELACGQAVPDHADGGLGCRVRRPLPGEEWIAPDPLYLLRRVLGA
jgi:hypothetical protein